MDIWRRANPLARSSANGLLSAHSPCDDRGSDYLATTDGNKFKLATHEALKGLFHDCANIAEFFSILFSISLKPARRR